MSQNSTLKFTQVLLYGVLALFGIHTLYELWCMLTMDFPFNFYESEVVTDAIAFHRGEPLFPLRSEGPWAGLYAPFYHIALSAMFYVFPETIITGRLISIISLLGIVYLIVKTTEKLPYRLIWALLGIFVWHESVALFDFHAKPDSFAILLSFLSIYIVLKKPTEFKWLILAAFMSSLSVATKQSMLFVPAGIGLSYILFKNWKSAFVFGVSFIATSVLVWFVLASITGPDMWYYVFVQPGTFRMRWGELFNNIWAIQNNGVWVLVLASFPFILSKWKQNQSELTLYIISFLALPACVLSATKGGGLVNSYQPFYYLISWLLLLIISERWTDQFSLKKLISENLASIQIAISLLILLIWSPNFASIITSYSFRSNADTNYERLISDINKLGGTVYCPNDNYVNYKAGFPLRWSSKWERETSHANLDNRPSKSSTSIALESHLVVTAHYYSWAKDEALEKTLLSNGYQKIDTYPLDQLREYRLWKKSTPQNHNE